MTAAKIVQDDVGSKQSLLPRALIFNQYLQTAGGGERLCFEIAAALEHLGYEVHFIMAAFCDVHVPTLARAFGIFPQGEWPVIHVADQATVAKVCKEGNYSIFINNTFESFLPNPAPIGMYVNMFPQPITKEHREAIASYAIVECISNFTELYTQRRWGAELNRIIMEPPISEIHFQKEPISLAEKEKLILCIGRFNVRGHNKCQLEAIKVFVDSQKKGVLSEDWRLVVAGRLNEGADNMCYLSECLKAGNGNVTILENISLDYLTSLYRKASALWQFTGFGKPFGYDPELCEHLGLVALDCFAYGTIPIVFHRGGLPYLISHGVNGYSFGTVEELQSIMHLIDRNFGSSFHEFQLIHAQNSAQHFTFDAFERKIQNALELARPQ